MPIARFQEKESPGIPIMIFVFSFATFNSSAKLLIMQKITLVHFGSFVILFVSNSLCSSICNPEICKIITR